MILRGASRSFTSALVCFSLASRRCRDLGSNLQSISVQDVHAYAREDLLEDLLEDWKRDLRESARMVVSTLVSDVH